MPLDDPQPDNPQPSHKLIPIRNYHGITKGHFAISAQDASWIENFKWELAERRVRTRSLRDGHIYYATKFIALAIQGYDLLELSPPEIVKLYKSQTPVKQLNRDTLDLRRENLQFKPLDLTFEPVFDGPTTDPSAIDPSIIDLSDEDWPALDKPIETDTNDLLARLSALDRGPRPEQNPNKK